MVIPFEPVAAFHIYVLLIDKSMNILQRLSGGGGLGQLSNDSQSAGKLAGNERRMLSDGLTDGDPSRE
jgi:hypothetical protein